MAVCVCEALRSHGDASRWSHWKRLGPLGMMQCNYEHESKIKSNHKIKIWRHLETLGGITECVRRTLFGTTLLDGIQVQDASSYLTLNKYMGS